MSKLWDDIGDALWARELAVAERRSRRAAKKAGLVARKSRVRLPSMNNQGGFVLLNPWNNQGGFVLLKPWNNYVIDGANFELTPEDVIEISEARS